MLRRALYRDLGASARYTFGFRNYYPAGYDAFTGYSQTGAAELNWGTPERPLEIGLAYLLTHDHTFDPQFSGLGHGARRRVRRVTWLRPISAR